MGFLFGCALVLGLVYWARQDAKRAERLAALKREIKEAARVQQMVDRVDRWPTQRVLERLRERRY